MKTFNITTRQIFDNAVASAQDIAFDSKGWDGQMELLSGVASQDINQLRQLFIDGYTPMMVGGALMDAIESVHKFSEIEIRIYKEENEKRILIGVIIDSEIKY